MKYFNWIILVAVFILVGFQSYSQKYKSTGEIYILNPRLGELFEQGAKPEIVADGFDWVEGPLWIADQQKLIFSDVPQNMIFEWTEANGIKPYLKPSGYTGEPERSGELGSNALLLNSEGELVICQHGDRRVVKMKASLNQPSPDFETIAATYNEKKLNSPNDAAYSKTGELYFTDPPYGLEKNMDDPTKELPFQGVFKVKANGEVQLFSDELSRPNGIAFSPDGKKLYVANSDSLHAIWMEYDVSEKELPARGRVFFDATNFAKTEAGLPDGLKVHPTGYIFATGPGGIFIFSNKGEIMGKIVTGQLTSNCAFNDDYSVLYITADDFLMRIQLKKSKLK